MLTIVPFAHGMVTAMCVSVAFVNLLLNSYQLLQRVHFVALALSLCHLLSASAIAQEESETTSPRQNLGPLSLGRISPNSDGNFLIEISPRVPADFEFVRVQKSCVCTKVSFLESPKQWAGKTVSVMLTLNSTSGIGRRTGEFFLVFLKGEEYRSVRQPFEYFVADEIDFGPDDCTVIQLVDQTKKSEMRVLNHGPVDWEEVIGIFEWEDHPFIRLQFRVEERKGESQVIPLEVTSLFKVIQDGNQRKGTLKLLARTKGNDRLFSHVATREIIVRPISKLKLIPDSVILDRGSESQTLRLLASQRLEDLELTNAKVEMNSGDTSLTFQRMTKSPKWVDLIVDSSVLRQYAGSSIDVIVTLENGNTERFVLPIRE